MGFRATPAMQAQIAETKRIREAKIVEDATREALVTAPRFQQMGQTPANNIIDDEVIQSPYYTRQVGVPNMENYFDLDFKKQKSAQTNHRLAQMNAIPGFDKEAFYAQQEAIKVRRQQEAIQAAKRAEMLKNKNQGGGTWQMQ